MMEGREFDSQIGLLEFFISIIIPGRTMVLGSTPPLTEMTVKAAGAYG
jgi:hypothetical protein